MDDIQTKEPTPRNEHVHSDESLRHHLEDVLEKQDRPTPNVRKMDPLKWVPLVAIAFFGFFNPLAMVWVWILEHRFGISRAGWFLPAHMFAFNATLFTLLYVPATIVTSGQSLQERKQTTNRIIMFHVAINLIAGCFGLVGILVFAALV